MRENIKPIHLQGHRAGDRLCIRLASTYHGLQFRENGDNLTYTAFLICKIFNQHPCKKRFRFGDKVLKSLLFVFSVT